MQINAEYLSPKCKIKHLWQLKQIIWHTDKM